MNDTAREELIELMAVAICSINYPYLGDAGVALLKNHEGYKRMAQAALSVLQPRLDAAEGMREALCDLSNELRDASSLIQSKATQACASYDSALCEGGKP